MPGTSPGKTNEMIPREFPYGLDPEFCRPAALARAGKGGDDAVQGAQFLLGASCALKQAAQVAHHARAAFAVAQKAVAYQLLFEMLEKIQQLLLCRRAAEPGVKGLGRRLGIAVNHS